MPRRLYTPLSQRKGSSVAPSNNQLEDTLRGISYVETRDNPNAYSIKGKARPSDGKRALGKYQVFETNLPSWSQEILGREYSPDEFLADPEAQEKIARTKIGESLQKYGTPEDAASVWFTGQPLAKAGGEVADYTGTSNSSYQQLFKQGMGRGQVRKYTPLAQRGSTMRA